MLSDGLFTALLFLISGVSVETVPSPTNVNVSCDNLKVTVSWEYSNEQPQTIFCVEISSFGSRWRWNTTDHQYDLTKYIWESQDRYMDNYHVTITAIQGQKESGAVLSQTFSFNSLKTPSLACKLQFPDVNLNENDSGATVSFINPYHHYKELKQASKSDSASLKVTVNSDAGDQTFECSAKQKNCRREVTFPEGEEKCVTLKGYLGASDYIGSVMFSETDPICAKETTGLNEEIHIIILATLLSAVVFIIAVVIIGIYKAKAWTMDTPSLPKSLEPNRREQVLNYDNVPITEVTVGPALNKSYKDSSVSSEENLQDCSARSDFKHFDGLYQERGLLEHSNQDLEAAGLLSEGQRTDDDSVKTECVSMDLGEEEEETSPYDCPHTLQLDMGNGDFVIGYKGS